MSGMDKEVIAEVYSMLQKVLGDIPESDGNRALRLVAERASALLEEQLQAGRVITGDMTDGASHPALTLPTEAPIKWSERATFRVEDIKDEHVRRKLDEHPDLVQTIRKCATRNPLTFLETVYGDYIDAGLMYQTDLRGGAHTSPLDKRLFDLCWQQCRDEGRDLNDHLPNKSTQVSRELAETDLTSFYRLKSRLYKKSMKDKKVL